MKYLLFTILMFTLTACGHMHYTSTGKSYTPTNSSEVAMYIDGRPLPSTAEQIGLISYKAKNKENAIERAQRLAAEHGGNAVYIPHPKGNIRTGIPRYGTFVVIHDRAISSSDNVHSAAPSAQLETKNEYERQLNKDFTLSFEPGEKAIYIGDVKEYECTIVEQLNQMKYRIKIDEEGVIKKANLERLRKVKPAQETATQHYKLQEDQTGDFKPGEKAMWVSRTTEIVTIIEKDGERYYKVVDSKNTVRSIQKDNLKKVSTDN